ncbi:MAG: hypothetical protein JWO44_1199, partial [Bacteroidetes bacterium]|nr:hypothetical protein [Bacteroidota bacterium]
MKLYSVMEMLHLYEGLLFIKVPENPVGSQKG